MKDKLFYLFSLVISALIGGFIVYLIYTKAVLKVKVIRYDGQTYVIKPMKIEEEHFELMKTLSEGSDLAFDTAEKYKKLYLETKEELKSLQETLILKNESESLKNELIPLPTKK